MKRTFTVCKRVIWLSAATLLLLNSCSVREISTLPDRQVTVGAGPEDMVMDFSQGTPRLLISCTARRESQEPFGEIVTYTPSTGAIDTLIRTGMPDTLFFQPHGIFLDNESNPPLLYAISHEHDEGFHPVYSWEVGDTALVFRELITSELLHSPNALTLGTNGELYVVNDAEDRNNMMEKIFRLNRANIVRLERNENGEWKAAVAAEGLGLPAGINRIGTTLYAGDAVNHLLHVYEIVGTELVAQAPVEGLRGNDNIRVIDQKLYTTGHVKPLKFVAHTQSPDKKSPVEVWEYDPAREKITSLYYTDGSTISAGSTALLLNGKLYISQVFEPFILEVDLPGL
ncbi:MAG: hypothetical protein P1P82_14120 [Bacteroidales bacterium]|nr:hypothetical protein [Bacteroidales bacterium]MDT8432639.1 hypothetical protein [Bacteroidales bacterium]